MRRTIIAIDDAVMHSIHHIHHISLQLNFDWSWATNSIKLYIYIYYCQQIAKLCRSFSNVRIFPYIMSASIYQPRDLFSTLSFYCIITLMNFRKKRQERQTFGSMVTFFNSTSSSNINFRMYTIFTHPIFHNLDIRAIQQK